MPATLRLCVLSLLLLVARGQHGGEKLEGQQSSPANGSASVSLLTAANREFAFRLYRGLAARPDSLGQNIFFSPLSVSVALAALAVGARGETHQQLFRGLGLSNTSLSQTHVDQAFQSLFEETRRTSGQVTREGTAVFVDHLFKPRPEFLHTLKKSYFADGFAVDFSKTSESTDAINKYVEEKTSGKIDKLVDNLDPTTVMYLISYIYFKGKMRSRCGPHSSHLGRGAEASSEAAITSELRINRPKLPGQGQLATSRGEREEEVLGRRRCWRWAAVRAPGSRRGGQRRQISHAGSIFSKTGKWESPFNPDRTKEDLFTVDEETKV